MARTGVDLSMLILVILAAACAGLAYWKDPGLPWIGAKTGLSMLGFILPRLVPALILAGMHPGADPPGGRGALLRHGRAGFARSAVASVAGVFTPGGPMVSVPFLVVLANSGVALAPLVAYMTSWSLFGMQRIIAWEAPLMGWRFVAVRGRPEPCLPGDRRLAGRSSTTTSRIRVAFADLREFVAHLEKRGQLRRVTAPVSRDLEITEITDRVSKGPAERQRGAAVRERVEGFDMPVLINAFGSPERMAAALGVERLDELAARVAQAPRLRMPGTFVEQAPQARRPLRRRQGRPRSACARRAVPGGGRDGPALARRAARRSSAGPATADATSRCPWCSRAIRARARATSACTASRCSTTGRSACTGRFTRAGAEHQRVAEERRRGAHGGGHRARRRSRHRSTRRRRRCRPASTRWSSRAGCAARGVPMVRCRTVDLEVPAEAEIVLEGYVDPAERRLEGPFGDHTGYYSLARDYPVFHLTALTRREAPDLSDHHRGTAAPGGLLARQGHRAASSCPSSA